MKIATLTGKREAFAQHVAKGKTQADAYRASFDAIKMKAETIQSAASRLMADSMVRARVEELRQKLIDKHLWTREDSVKRLREVADKDEAKGAEIVAAIKELNLMHGFNAPTRIDLGGTITLIERHIIKSK